MIPAQRRPRFARWFARQAEARLRRSFGRVRLLGLSHLREASAAGPVLVVSNHASWWDPLVALWLTNRVLALEAYALMDAANLRRLPFFGPAGAVGVDLADPRDGARVLRHLAGLLRAPGQLVWVFPQGREQPADAPLQFEAGAAAVARTAGAAVRVLPIALRYEHGHEARPWAWISVGAPLPAVERRAGLAATADLQAEAVAAELTRLASAIRDLADANVAHRSAAGGSAAARDGTGPAPAAAAEDLLVTRHDEGGLASWVLARWTGRPAES